MFGRALRAAGPLAIAAIVVVGSHSRGGAFQSGHPGAKAGPNAAGSPVRTDPPRRTRTLVPIGGTGANLRDAAARSLAALPGWTAVVDATTGLPARAFGPGIAVPRQGTWEADLARFADEFLRRNTALLGFVPSPDGTDLKARPPVRGGRTWYRLYDAFWKGVPVEGARVELRFVREALTLVRIELPGTLDLSTVPAVDREWARRAAERDARRRGRPPIGDARIRARDPLVVVAADDAWSLAWAAEVDVDGPRGRLTVWIDAGTGRVIAARDAFRHGGGPVDTPLTVTGSFEARKAGSALSSAPFADLFASVGGDLSVTDSAGVATVAVSAPATEVQLGLQGPFTSVLLYEGSSATATASVDPGVPASFAWGDADSLLVERDVFHSHAVVRARMKRMAPDVEWLDTQVPLTVEVSDAGGCNAFWDGEGAQFFAESATCNATGRVADVVYHEIGHGLHQHLSAGGFLAGDIGEGSSDYLAATINGDPDIGPSFFKANPEGIRNLEPDLRYPDDVDGTVHHDGLIWGGAFWDYRASMIATLGTDAGVEIADRLLADALRNDPSLEEGFYDVLFAADDDGNVTNGVPHLCEIVGSFGAHGLGPGDGLAVDHVPLGLQPPERNGYVVRVHIGAAYPQCAPSNAGVATLEWRVGDQGPFASLEMSSELVPGWRTGTIPPQSAETRVEYRVRAVDPLGREATSPPRNFETTPFSFAVGRPAVLFRDDFEADRGWTHRLVDGPDQQGADDWQIGPPNGASGDPPSAFSGANVAGNDLGVDPFNGAYQPNVINRFESPEIDCRNWAGVRLQFRRWLQVEEGEYDRATVYVGDRAVWTNPTDEALRDEAWRFEEVDLSRYADGKKIRIAFELASDGGVQLGGWTLDDVTVVADGPLDEVIPACGCSLTGRRGPAAGIVVAVALAALAIALRRRAA